ncbi:MAG: hypothetical protein OXH93_08030 [Caldilineaceae bacterium]|nr:hypothetical protein [Caldilineaceae bacterium]
MINRHGEAGAAIGEGDGPAGMAVQIDVGQDIHGAIVEIDASRFDKWLQLIFLWRRE